MPISDQSLEIEIWQCIFGLEKYFLKKTGFHVHIATHEGQIRTMLWQTAIQYSVSFEISINDLCFEPLIFFEARETHSRLEILRAVELSMGPEMTFNVRFSNQMLN